MKADNQAPAFTADDLNKLVAIREKTQSIRKAGKGKGNALLTLLEPEERELMIRWLCYQLSGGRVQ